MTPNKICPIISNHPGYHFRECLKGDCQMWIAETNKCGFIEQFGEIQTKEVK